MWEPFGVISVNDTTGWRASPNQRGTLNILSTCVLTLFLCAYTSLHLNIPKEGKRGWTNEFSRRTLWVCIGLAAPEYLAYVAFGEFVEARNLEFKMHNLTQALVPASKAEAGLLDEDVDIELEERTLGVENADSSRGSANSQPRFNDEDRPMLVAQNWPRVNHSQIRVHPWTRVHSHFALMGGYVFDFNKEHRTALGIKSKRRILTPVALRALAEHAPELLPDISTSSILDKSKANALAKLLVCTQAVWFLTQTIGRLATRLPITLLEFNTGLHAVCSLFIYLAWWQKPLDIEEPYLIKIAGQFPLNVCAWMLVMDRSYFKPWPESNSTGAPDNHLMHDNGCASAGDQQLSQEEHDEYTPIVAGKKLYRTDGRPSLLTRAAVKSQLVPKLKPEEEDHVLLYTGQSIHGFVLMPSRPPNAVHPGACSRVPLRHVERLRLAQSLRLEERHRSIGSMEPSRTLGGKMLAQNLPFQGQHALDSTLHKWRHKRMLPPRFVLVLTLMLAGSLYGGLHIFAWNGPFTTAAERELWRVSCVIIAGPLPFALAASVVLAPIVVFFIVCGPGSSFWECGKRVKLMIKRNPSLAIISKVLYWCLCWVLDAIHYVAIGVYLAARAYLIVECFINLAHLPEAVFQEPDWSQYIPHFGAG